MAVDMCLHPVTRENFGFGISCAHSREETGQAEVAGLTSRLDGFDIAINKALNDKMLTNGCHKSRSH